MPKIDVEYKPNTLTIASRLQGRPFRYHHVPIKYKNRPLADRRRAGKLLNPRTGPVSRVFLTEHCAPVLSRDAPRAGDLVLFPYNLDFDSTTPGPLGPLDSTTAGLHGFIYLVNTVGGQRTKRPAQQYLLLQSGRTYAVAQFQTRAEHQLGLEIAIQLSTAPTRRHQSHQLPVHGVEPTDLVATLRASATYSAEQSGPGLYYAIVSPSGSPAETSSPAAPCASPAEALSRTAADDSEPGAKRVCRPAGRAPLSAEPENMTDREGVVTSTNLEAAGRTAESWHTPGSDLLPMSPPGPPSPCPSLSSESSVSWLTLDHEERSSTADLPPMSPLCPRSPFPDLSSWEEIQDCLSQGLNDVREE